MEPGGFGFDLGRQGFDLLKFRLILLIEGPEVTLGHGQGRGLVFVYPGQDRQRSIGHHCVFDAVRTPDNPSGEG